MPLLLAAKADPEALGSTEICTVARCPTAAATKPTLLAASQLRDVSVR